MLMSEGEFSIFRIEFPTPDQRSTMRFGDGGRHDSLEFNEYNLINVFATVFLISFTVELDITRVCKLFISPMLVIRLQLHISKSSREVINSDGRELILVLLAYSVFNVLFLLYEPGMDVIFSQFDIFMTTRSVNESPGGR